MIPLKRYVSYFYPSRHIPEDGQFTAHTGDFINSRNLFEPWYPGRKHVADQATTFHGCPATTRHLAAEIRRISKQIRRKAWPRKSSK
jgi:hypothetical protein